MKKKLLIIIIPIFLFVSQVFAQDCTTSAELDIIPGKHLTAAQYPWPAVRAEYFNKMTSAADKATAKKILSNIETLEAQSRTGFTLTGGNWENYYSTEGYTYYGNAKLGAYTFQSALYEFICVKGKLKRNGEFETVLRTYVNKMPINNDLGKYLYQPFGGNLGEYNFGIQYKDWKNHKSVNVNDPLISLFNYFACNTLPLIDAINNGNKYWQDVAEKDIKPNNRSIFITRYWFTKKSTLPLLLPVSRKEYLQSLLEYYEREKIYFPMLIDKMTKEKDSRVTKYSTWAKDVYDKIAAVTKTLNEKDEKWLAQQAVVNRIDDNAQTKKASLYERINYNRFWGFASDGDKRAEPLYQYNADYFKTSTTQPQFITVAFRYVPVPSSLRLLTNFTTKFNFDGLQKMVN